MRCPASMATTRSRHMYAGGFNYGRNGLMDRQPRILVVGDAMWDRYHFGTTTRVSPEAPIPVVKISSTETFLGGALNVEANLGALGASVKTISGSTYSDYTTTQYPEKNRLMVGTHQLARWDEFDDVTPIEIKRLDQAVLHWPPDAIVVSDYG